MSMEHGMNISYNFSSSSSEKGTSVLRNELAIMCDFGVVGFEDAKVNVVHKTSEAHFPPGKLRDHLGDCLYLRPRTFGIMLLKLCPLRETG